jgi:uncharacterized protein
MTPFRFRSSGHQMFAIYQRPVDAVDRNEAVLICNPFGQEAIRAHRLLKLVADRLVRNGLHVMRFDYLGTGDSDGDDAEAKFDGFLADTLAAHQELRHRSGVSAISWFGVRLGASVAAIASSSVAESLKQLVLWEPVFDGKQYLHELDEAHSSALRRDYGARWFLDLQLQRQFNAEAGSEALGFVLSESMRAHISALTPEKLRVTNASKVVFFCTLDAGKLRPADEQVSQSLIRGGLTVSVNDVPERIVWTANEMMNTSVAPSGVLAAIAGSFSEAA